MKTWIYLYSFGHVLWPPLIADDVDDVGSWNLNDKDVLLWFWQEPCRHTEQLLVARLQRMKRVAWWTRPELGLAGTLALTSGNLSKQLNWYLACHTRRLGEWLTLGAKDTLWRRIQLGVQQHCGATRICREICQSTPLTTWIPWIEPI